MIFFISFFGRCIKYFSWYKPISCDDDAAAASDDDDDDDDDEDDEDES